jgi:hypothetical protein
MGIPESQLETWSHQGSITQSSNTYNTIKNALEGTDTPYANKTYKVFLQGSYGNDTNIYAESDVDIVIRLDDCWQSDVSHLSDLDKASYKEAFVDAKYGHVALKRDVLQVLTDRYGGAVKAGSKAIAIAANGSRRKADVIVAVQYRRYYKFKSTADQSYDEGICFWNSDGTRIANYPKQHSANLTRKHQETNKWLKPMARILKNLRSRLVDDGLMEAGIAPSYYLEGLLYNVPTNLFGRTYQESLANAINWIHNEADKDKLLCANEQYYLLRDNAHTCWSRANCDAFIAAAIELWNDW